MNKIEIIGMVGNWHKATIIVEVNDKGNKSKGEAYPQASEDFQKFKNKKNVASIKFPFQDTVRDYHNSNL